MTTNCDNYPNNINLDPKNNVNINKCIQNELFKKYPKCQDMINAIKNDKNFTQWLANVDIKCYNSDSNINSKPDTQSSIKSNKSYIWLIIIFIIIIILSILYFFIKKRQ